MNSVTAPPAPMPHMASVGTHLESGTCRSEGRFVWQPHSPTHLKMFSGAKRPMCGWNTGLTALAGLEGRNAPLCAAIARTAVARSMVGEGWAGGGCSPCSPPSLPFPSSARNSAGDGSDHVKDGARQPPGRGGARPSVRTIHHQHHSHPASEPHTAPP